MEVRSSAYNHRDHVAHRRDINLEAERLRDGLAIEQQLRAVWRSRFLRVQVFAVVGPLRSAALIGRKLAVHNEHPGSLPFRVIPDISVMVAVRAEGQFPRVPSRVVRRLRFAIKHETFESPSTRLSHSHITEEVNVLVVRGEAKLAT